ncbi:hypothetical protein ACFYUY_34935 [Kitasatospora sp. NPDC004745]
MAHVHYACWNCDADNRVHGEGCDCCNVVEVPESWFCWNCDAENFCDDD